MSNAVAMILFADNSDLVSQLVSAWPTLLVAAPILAAMIASIILQVQSRLTAAKKAATDNEIAAKAMGAVVTAERAGQAASSAAKEAGAAVEAAEEIGRAAAVAALDAKNAVAVAHSAVVRSTRTFEAAREAAEKAEGRRLVAEKATSDKLDALAQVSKSTHMLVNNKMRVALASIAAMSRRIANLPGATQDDRDAAREAADELADHDARQGKVDSENDS